MATDVRANITGTVWKIEVTAGEAVEEDDVLIIVESMKMEMPVEAPVDGTVVEIRVTPGQAVAEGEVVARIDPAG